MEEEQKEVIEIEKSDKADWKQILFLILLFFALIALIAAIITIHRYEDMLSNPVGYNLAKFNIDSCSCIDNYGKFIEIVSTNKTS